MEFCEAGSLDSLYKKVKSKGWRTGEKVLGKIADSVSPLSSHSRQVREIDGFSAIVDPLWFGLSSRPQDHSSR